jgi:helix-turn-helix protein
MADQEWLTITQAAARAGVGPARIRQLVQRGQVEYTRSKPGAHDTRIAAASLAAWQTHKPRGRPPGTRKQEINT